MVKKVVIGGAVGLTLVLVLLLLIPLSFRLNSDVENVKLNGVVYDKASKKPVNGAALIIENWMYEGGDYDGYGSSQLHRKTTDAKGNFSLYLPKSAFIVVYASKKGYVSDTVSSDAYENIDLSIKLRQLDKTE